MTGAVAPGRLRSMCAVVAVAGILLSLGVLCCCRDVAAPPLPGASASGVALHVAPGGMTDAAGHADPDCNRSATSDAALPTSWTGTAAAVIPAARVMVETAPSPSPGVGLLAPVPHLLCVMRT